MSRERVRERRSRAFGRRDFRFGYGFDKSGKSRNGSSKDFWEHLVSVFIDNLNPMVDVAGLWDGGHSSFVDIVKDVGRSTKGRDKANVESRKTIKWNARKEDVEWAEFSVIGILKSLKSIAGIRERLYKRGVPFEVNYIGGLKTMWSFRSDKDRRDFLIHRFLWDDVLENVIIYASNYKWIRISGFPAKIWCSSFFKAIGNSFGLTLHIEDRAALKGRLEQVRILVAMAENQSCPSSVMVEVGSASIMVEVKEVDEVPSEEWFGDILCLHPNSWDSSRSEKVSSPAKKTSHGKLVIFENQGRGRVSPDNIGVATDGTTARSKVGFSSVQHGKGLVGGQSQSMGGHRLSVGREGQNRVGSAKGKATLASKEKVVRRPSERATGVVIGKVLRMAESTSDSSLPSGDEGDRPGPSLLGAGSAGPSIGVGLDRAVGHNRFVDLEDPIAESVAVLPPFGQRLLSPHDLFVDLGPGVNILNSSQSTGEVSSSSFEEEGEPRSEKGKVSAGLRGRSSCRGAKGRGRRRAVIPSSHGMRTRRSSQRSSNLSTGGSEWEFEDEFAKVIEESVVRGVNLSEPNPCYGEDGGCARGWKIAIHAICWTIWETRNMVVFNQGDPSNAKALDTVRWRIACWFNNGGQGSPLSPAYLMLNLKLGCVDLKRVNRKKASFGWKPPPEGFLKFNVDGSSRGNPGPSGIGGILRNSVGDVLCMFSSVIDDGSSVAAELAAILQACKCCVSVMCPTDLSVIIESDSRSSNVAADFLAKQGVFNGVVQMGWAA
ncbi:hypothetical protein Q3G72_029398 [Acer saccharum]|nr:hypothetical protein Q3G72_029398 [Acer saccharum]